MAVAMRSYPADQRGAVDALDRRLAGRVNVSNQHRVGIVETGAEALEQIGQAGVAVRLHHGDNLSLGDRASRLEHRRDLDRVMAVIVDDRDPVPLAGLGKAAAYALKVSQARPHHRVTEL